MNNASQLLLIALALTLCRDVPKREGHSTSTYYISEPLPLEACPVILGEILWRHVMTTESEAGFTGCQAATASQTEPQRRAQSLLMSISPLLVMQM